MVSIIKYKLNWKFLDMDFLCTLIFWYTSCLKTAIVGPILSVIIRHIFNKQCVNIDVPSIKIWTIIMNLISEVRKHTKNL